MQESQPALGEAALRQAAAGGDAAAWNALYDSAYDSLYRYVHWRTGGRRCAAEEVVQETWLTAVRLVARFDPQRGTFARWLRGIAANAVRNYLRREATRRKGEQATDNLAESAAASDRHADQQLEETALAVTAALAELPDHYEDVLRAKYLDGDSVESIAAARNQTAKAIESMLTRAREAFRTAYARLERCDQPTPTATRP
jgi:RNA polymerase sigma-70 factor (ECF subfamily)